MRRCFVVCVLVICMALSPVGWAYSLSISKEQIQEKLEKKFPLKKNKGLFWIELSNPKSELDSVGNQLGLTVDIRFQLLEKVHRTGTIRLLGEPAYDAKNGEFYLHKIKIAALTLGDARADQRYFVRKLLEKVVKKKLKRVKLYRLQTGKLYDQLLKSQIQGVKVETDKVVVELVSTAHGG